MRKMKPRRPLRRAEGMALLSTAYLLVALLCIGALRADAGLIAEGDLIQPYAGGPIYVVENGERHFIPDEATFNARRYNWAFVRVVSSADFNSIPEGYAFLPEGALIRASGTLDVWIVKYSGEKQFRRLILSPHVFDSYEHLRWEDILDVSQATVDSFTESALVRADGGIDVYQLSSSGEDTGWRLWVQTLEEGTEEDDGDDHEHGLLDADAVYTVNLTDLNAYQDGGDLP